MMDEVKKKIKSIVYWECDLGHEHKSEAVAETCVRKRRGQTGYDKKWRVSTYSAIVRLRLSGATYKEIGRVFNIGGQRAADIYKECVAIANGKWKWAYGEKVTNEQLIIESLDPDAIAKLRSAIAQDK